MPYIRDDRREEVACYPSRTPENPGELNFSITNLIMAFLEDVSTMTGVTPGYAEFNEVIGVLECIKLEFYRRVVAGYEEEKCKEHGDVF